MVEGRLTQEPVEVSWTGDPSNLRVSQAAVEVISHNGAKMRVTQAIVEIMRKDVSHLRLTHGVVEVIYRPEPNECFPDDFVAKGPLAVVNSLDTGTPYSSASPKGNARADRDIALGSSKTSAPNTGGSRADREAPQIGSVKSDAPGTGSAGRDS